MLTHSTVTPNASRGEALLNLLPPHYFNPSLLAYQTGMVLL